MRSRLLQPSLFAPDPGNNGTATSRAAAAMAKPLASQSRTEVLELLAKHPEGLTEEQISRRLNRRLAGVCGRVNELGNLGSVVALAKQAKTSSGRPAMLFIRSDDAAGRPLAPWPRSRVDWKSRAEQMERRAIDAERRLGELQALLLHRQGDGTNHTPSSNPPADVPPARSAVSH